MKSTAATIIAILAAATEASPLARRDVCNTAPTGSGNPTALSKPSVATALACQQACAANASCKAFVFGLPPNANAPTCILYPVAAAQIPSQGTDLNVFDLACSSAQVPTSAPTHDQPIGTVPSAGSNNNNNGNNGAQNGQSPRLMRRATCNTAPTATGSRSPISSPVVTTALLCQQSCTSNPSCQAFVFGLPPTDSTPKCLLFDVPAAQIPSQGTDLNVFDIACTTAQVPTTVPTHAQPIGQVPTTTGNNNNNNNGAQTGNTGSQNGQTGTQTGNTGTQNGQTGTPQTGNTGAQTGNTGSQTGNTGAQTGNTGAQNGQSPKLMRRATCNTAPTATGSKSPISSPVVTTALLCQQACAANPSCQAFVFGLPPADSSPKCLLFDVPAAQIPSQGSDLNVFDIGCTTAQVPTTVPTHSQPIGQVPATTGNNNGAQTGNTGSQNGQNGAQTGANNGAQGQH